MCTVAEIITQGPPLQTFADYERALTLAETLLAIQHTEHGARWVEILLARIEAYERAHYPHVSQEITCLHCSTELAATCPHCHPDAWAHL